MSAAGSSSLHRGRLFPRHAWDDIVDGVDAATPDISVRVKYGFWDRATFDLSLNNRRDVTPCNYVVDDKGIWLRGRFSHESSYDFFCWHPQAELEHGSDPRTTPILPFPFSGSELAAFIAHGTGWLAIGERLVACIEDANGHVDAAARLMVDNPNSVTARHALHAAWMAWKAAAAQCRFDPLKVPDSGFRVMVRSLLEGREAGPPSPDSGVAQFRRTVGGGGPRVTWRRVLHERIAELDAAHGGHATVQQAITWLRKLGDPKIPDERLDDGLVWIDETGSERRAARKTVATALAEARRPATRSTT